MPNLDILKDKTKNMLGFSAPIIASNILIMLIGLTDMIVAKHFGQNDGANAIGSGVIIVFLVTNFALGLSCGCMINIGNAYKQNKDVKWIFVLSLIIDGIIIVTISTIILVFSDKMLMYLNNTVYVAIATYKYIFISILGSIVTVLFYNFMALAKGIGDSNFCLLQSSIAFATNLLFDIVFMFLNLDVYTLAIATIIAELLSIIPFFMSKRYNFIYNKSNKPRFDILLVLRIIRIAFPLGIINFLGGLSYFFIGSLFQKNVGIALIGSYAFLTRIESIASIPSRGFQNSISSVIARNKKDYISVFIGLVFSIIIACIFSTILIFTATPFSSLTGIEPNNSSILSIKLLSLDFVFTSIGVTIFGYIEGEGHTTFSLIVNAISSGVRLLTVWFLITYTTLAPILSVVIGLIVSSFILIPFASVYIAKTSKKTHLKK